VDLSKGRDRNRFLFNHQVSPEQAPAELGDGRLETRSFEAPEILVFR
jgi:hypothetical protein